MRFLVPLLTCWILAAGAASAQKKKAVEVRFAAQAVPPGLGEVVMAAGDIRSGSFALPRTHLSAPLDAPGRAFRLEAAAKPGLLATVQLPGNGTAFVILLVPGVKEPFEAVVIPDRDAAFRPGDYYLHNTFRQPVLGKAGTTTFVIPPRTGQVVRPKGARENRFYDVTLGVRDGRKSRVISTSRWPVGGQMRTYVFFFHNPKRGDVDFRAIDEFVPPEEKD